MVQRGWMVLVKGPGCVWEVPGSNLPSLHEGDSHLELEAHSLSAQKVAA